MFFEGSNGLLFLLTLIRADDSALYAEIQTYLDAVDHAGNPFRNGFRAVLALLLLLRGMEPKARTLLDDLRKLPIHEPLSSALVALVEFLIDPVLAKARIKDTEARFAALAETLPAVARIHAEITARKFPANPRATRTFCFIRAQWRRVHPVHRAHQVATAVGTKL